MGTVLHGLHKMMSKPLIPDPTNTSDGTLVLGPRYGGSFALQDGGQARLCLPGERVHIESGVLEVLNSSSDRVSPGCQHFGVCGGCHYQHAAYQTQVRMKAIILGDLLGIENPSQIQTHVAEPWGYRNRVRLRVEQSCGEFRLGYSRPGTNEFLPIEMCPITMQLLWNAGQALLRIGRRGAHNLRWLSSIKEVELFASGEGTRIQLSLLMREPVTGGLELLCEQLRAELPELAGVGAELHPEAPRRGRRRWGGASWGTPGLLYAVGGRDYWVRRGGFFQVNRFLVDRLLALVTEGESGTLAWDLFAGVGLFARALAERFDRVVAVEGGEAAAADLALAGRGGKGHPAFSAIHAASFDFLRAQELQRERPDLIVLDPPRAGLGVGGVGVLGRIRAGRVVYVSCDPETLARDLKVLIRDGYQVEEVHLVDMFPQTYHLETVVKLRLR